MTKKKEKKTLMCSVVKKLPKDAKTGECFSMLKKDRVLTFKKTRPRGKNKNLLWKIVANTSVDKIDMKIVKQKKPREGRK